MKRRIWKRRRDGVRQRYWTGRKKRKVLKRKFETRPIDEAPFVQLYHGTSEHSIPHIKKEGLQPWNKTGNSQFGWLSPPDTVSLTPHKWQADWYAKKASKGITKPTVLKVVVSGEEYRKGKKEGNWSGESITKDEVRLPNISPDKIKGVLLNPSIYAEKELDKQVKLGKEYDGDSFRSVFDEN